MDPIKSHREMMKSGFGLNSDGPSDQQKGVAYPPLEKPIGSRAQPVELPRPEASAIKKVNVHACLADRRSRRDFSPESLALPELSFLLWATQGVREVLGEGYATLRTVPSAGARHPYETYLIVHRVTELSPGIYRYLPLTHRLLPQGCPDRLPARTTAAALGQGFAGHCAAVFVWACLPYRGEWRYRAEAHKVALLDAGHIAQNLYIACEAIACGTCGIAAYDQRAFDALLGLDGADEFVVYLAPVGKL